MSKKEKNQEKKKSSLIYNILILFFVLVFIGSAAYLLNYYFQSKKSESKVDELKELIVVDDSTGEEGEMATPSDPFVEINGVRIQKKYENLYIRNNNFIGWLSIEGTKVDYPVVMTPDNEEYYLRRDYDGKKSTAGTLFADTSSDIEKPSDNILIYGHNMKAGTMFHDILQYQEEDFYKNHKFIKFNTIYGDGVYEVIAAYKTEIKPMESKDFKYYQFFNAADELEFNDFVYNSKALTAYNIPISAVYGDKLITLSTCSYHAEEGRFVVVAKRINYDNTSISNMVQ